MPLSERFRNFFQKTKHNKKQYIDQDKSLTQSLVESRFIDQEPILNLDNYSNEIPAPVSFSFLEDLQYYGEWLYEQYLSLFDYFYPGNSKASLSPEDIETLKKQAATKRARRELNRHLLQRQKTIRQTYNEDIAFFNQKKRICENWYHNLLENLKLKREHDINILVEPGADILSIPGWEIVQIDRNFHTQELCQNLRCSKTETFFPPTIRSDPNLNFDQQNQINQLYQQSQQCRQDLVHLQEELKLIRFNYDQCQDYVHKNSNYNTFFPQKERLNHLTLPSDISPISTPSSQDQNNQEYTLNEIDDNKTIVDTIAAVGSFPMKILTGEIFNLRKYRGPLINHIFLPIVRALLTFIALYIYYRTSTIIYMIITNFLESALSYLPKKNKIDLNALDAYLKSREKQRPKYKYKSLITPSFKKILAKYTTEDNYDNFIIEKRRELKKVLDERARKLWWKKLFLIQGGSTYNFFKNSESLTLPIKLKNLIKKKYILFLVRLKSFISKFYKFQDKLTRIYLNIVFLIIEAIRLQISPRTSSQVLKNYISSPSLKLGRSLKLANNIKDSEIKPRICLDFPCKNQEIIKLKNKKLVRKTRKKCRITTLYDLPPMSTNNFTKIDLKFSPSIRIQI